MASMDISNEMNYNLTAPHRELMLWHHKWANCDTGHVQTLITMPRDDQIEQCQTEARKGVILPTSQVRCLLPHQDWAVIRANHNSFRLQRSRLEG
jgi:hypothetical protein